ncbi:outer membrane beta-barrel protein [Mucilaginibacter sp. UR6-11]|uniref:outer membrane beta-barrel protein n=1 Tax=Mucilaginibacter sp. UR6-11 TaxID=1435644 RepID=UPI001E617B7E|nr:outer membrane beta-barrel protein [Mucilaginibacter sp. UR6-11]MCC8426303.1 TonB-dependent receptor family protein [Mucilaginibacter sp. UR6-11]
MRTASVFYLSKILAFITLVLFSSTALAQNKASVRGNILDSISRSPIEYATVAIVNAKDTSLISYTLTQKDGSFKLSGLPADVETKLIISTMGYTTFRKLLVFKPSEIKNTGSIFLTTRILNEVTVKGERSPVVIKKDTLEFNTEAFKTRPNAVVEDLLKLLPGVQVNVDGSILVNGQAVSKLLIGGKRFFGSDPTVGTKNLDADLVDKIQVYDDREEDPDHKLTEIEVGKIINLIMKSKIKKSTIGKVYAGGGTRGRYEAGGIVSTFRDTLQISLIGLANNLNKTGFSSSELYSMGGFNRSGGNQQYDGTFGGAGYGGMEKIFSGGFNINNDYGKKLKTNLMYFYSNSIKDYNTKAFNQQALDQTTLNTFTSNISQVKQQNHTVSTLIDWVPDTIKRVRFSARGSIAPLSNFGNGTTNTSNTQTPRITDLLTNTSSKGTSNQFYNDFMYYRKLKKQGASFTLGESLDLKKTGADNYNYNNLTSYITAINSSVLDRYIDNNSTSQLAGVYLTLNTPISKKITHEFFVNSRYRAQASTLSTYDKNIATGIYDQFLSDQSNDLEKYMFIQNVKNTFSYDINKKTTLKVGADLEIQYISYKFNTSIKNINANYYRVFPVFRLNGQNFNINYYEYLSHAEMYQLQPITRQISPVETLSGNPNLVPMHEHYLYFNYYGNNRDKQIYTNINAGVNYISNNIVQSSTKDDNGFITSIYENKDVSWSGNLNISVNKQFKKTQKWQLSLNPRFFSRYSRQAFFFNGDQGMQANIYLTGSESIGLNYKSVINLNTTYFINAALSRYSGVNYAAVNTVRQRVLTVATVTLPNHFIFDAQYQYDYNPQAASGFSKSSNVVNLAVTLTMLKQNRGQLKLSVYDLFDQNTSVYRYAGNNSITNVEQQILKRYFLIGYQYKLNSFKSK